MVLRYKLLVIFPFLLYPIALVNGNEIPLSIDVSYQPRISKATLMTAIQENLLSTNGQTNHVSIDVSYSELGDTGLDDFMKLLQEIRPVGSLDITSHMNRITPLGASSFIRPLLGKENVGVIKGETSSIGEEEIEKTSESPNILPFSIRVLDLSWNNFHREEPGAKNWLSDLRELIESHSSCPQSLILNRCSLGPAATRSIGKAIAKRFIVPGITPLSLHLCGNPDIGDAGAAALAAAIRASQSKETIFTILDLSACNIGDAGAEALAVALESHPFCIQKLILSNNKISNSGASFLSRGIAKSNAQLELLELDNNPAIGSSGATSLAVTFGNGNIQYLSLRSCDVQADGAKAFGESLKTLATINPKGRELREVGIDLSGNPIGMLRKKKKESFTNIASATTASYMSYIGKQIKSGLKDVGLDSVLLSNSAESDDEEEERMSGDGSNGSSASDEPIRCGAKAFASTFVLNEEKERHPSQSDSVTSLICSLGLRHCFLDEGAADALAATIVQSGDKFGIQLLIDASLNHVLEDHMVQALKGKNRDALDDMAERHLECVEVIRVAEQRASQASRLVSKRSRVQSSDEHDYEGLLYEENDEEEEDVDDDDYY
jgi:Leucine Rich repeat